MTLNDIAPDTMTLLTEKLLRLFRYAGCEPECHACHTTIEVNQEFQLVTHGKQEPRDVMLCSSCTLADLIKTEKRERRKELRGRDFWGPTSRGGYSRPSRVR